LIGRAGGLEICGFIEGSSLKMASLCLFPENQ
jgi:hypothetical protein